jgi:hypothetical protein
MARVKVEGCRTPTKRIGHTFGERGHLARALSLRWLLLGVCCIIETGLASFRLRGYIVICMEL